MPASRSGRPGMHPTVAAYVENRELAETYDAYFADNPLFRYDCLFLEEHLPPGGAVLDLGCGTGRHLVFLASSGCAVTGLDLNPHMLRVAALNLEANRARGHLVRGDFTALPFADRPLFDAVVLMFSTLGLVRGAARRVEALAKIRRLLRPGGVLAAHFHNRHYGLTAGRRARQALAALARLSEPGDQVMRGYRGVLDLFLHCFDENEIRALAREAGYEIVELRRLNSGRDGPYLGPDPEYNANGFLLAARA